MSDHEQRIRRLESRLASMVQRGVVSTSADDEGIPGQQAKGIGGRPLDALEYMQPQGLYFRPVVGAEGVILCPTGQTSGAVLVNASSRGASPGGEGVPEGAGGLHYAGTFKLYLANDGTLHLGEKDASDFVALASKVQADLDALRDAFNSHMHATAGTGAPSPPTPGAGIPVVLTIGGVASEKVRAS